MKAKENNPFEIYPGFIEQDNRINRIHNPITLEVLTNKHKAILPPDYIKNKTVLDLGSCIGATGNWCLYYGAASYTGVEVQSQYANISRELLAPYGHRAKIITKPLESFLDSHKGNYDIVLLMAVLHVFIDYNSVVCKACNLSKQAVIIENLYPQVPGCIVQYSDSCRINLASSNSSLEGRGVRISLLALNTIMSTAGFTKAPDIVVSPIKGSVDVYNNSGMPESRYIARYYRADIPIVDLSVDLATKTAGKKVPWKQKNVPWLFDESVANNFSLIARANIPNYEQVINKCVQVAVRVCDSNDRIIDVGSALGFTLHKLYNAGFRNLFGVEESEYMIR